MPFIWNDNTFWKRLIKQSSIHNKITLPILLFSFFFLYIFMPIRFIEAVLIGYIFALWVYTTIDLFMHYPHFKIPDSYSPLAKKVMYIVFFMLTSLILYVVTIGVLHQHYPFLEDFICCDFVKNMRL